MKANIQVQKEVDFDHMRLEYRITIGRGYKETTEKQHAIGIVGTFSVETLCLLCDKQGKTLHKKTETIQRFLPMILNQDGEILPRAAFRTGRPPVDTNSNNSNRNNSNIFIKKDSILYSKICEAWKESDLSKTNKGQKKEAIAFVKKMIQDRANNRIQANNPDIAKIMKETNNYEGPSQ